MQIILVEPNSVSILLQTELRIKCSILKIPKIIANHPCIKLDGIVNNATFVDIFCLWRVAVVWYDTRMHGIQRTENFSYYNI